MVDGSVHTATIGVEPANRDVVDGDESGQHHHGGEMPEAAVAGEGKPNPHHVGNARSPIAIEDSSTAHPAQNAGAAGGECGYTRRRLCDVGDVVGQRRVWALKRGSRDIAAPAFPNNFRLSYYFMRSDAIDFSKAGRKSFLAGS